MIYRFNAFLKLQLGFALPIPLRNHFYKGKRLSFRKYWFCENCNHVFDLIPWKEYKEKPAHELTCPRCNSNQVGTGTTIAKAIIDGKSAKEIKQMIKGKRFYND